MRKPGQFGPPLLDKDDALSSTITVSITPPLERALLSKCAVYGITRSNLVRAVLELVDDGDLWAELLGPPPNMEKVKA
jgi:hypothetical protein